MHKQLSALPITPPRWTVDNAVLTPRCSSMSGLSVCTPKLGAALLLRQLITVNFAPACADLADALADQPVAWSVKQHRQRSAT